MGAEGEGGQAEKAEQPPERLPPAPARVVPPRGWEAPQAIRAGRPPAAVVPALAAVVPPRGWEAPQAASGVPQVEAPPARAAARPAVLEARRGPGASRPRVEPSRARTSGNCRPFRWPQALTKPTGRLWA